MHIRLSLLFRHLIVISVTLSTKLFTKAQSLNSSSNEESSLQNYSMDSLNSWLISDGHNQIILPVSYSSSSAFSQENKMSATQQAVQMSTSVEYFAKNNLATTATESINVWISMDLQLSTSVSWKRQLKNLKRAMKQIRNLAENANSIYPGTVPGILLNVSQTSLSSGGHDRSVVLYEITRAYFKLINSFQYTKFPYKFGVIMDNIEWWCNESEFKIKLLPKIDVILLTGEYASISMENVKKAVNSECLEGNRNMQVGVIFSVPHAADVEINGIFDENKENYKDILVFDKVISGFGGLRGGYLARNFKEETLPKAEARGGGGRIRIIRVPSGGEDSGYGWLWASIGLTIFASICRCIFCSKDEE